MESTWLPSMTKSPSNQGWKPLLQPSDPLPPPMPKNGSRATPPIPPPSKNNGWSWDFFNFGTKEVVVTQTLRELHTTKYLDPNTVVTFSVKGCRPSRLPFDLPECEPHMPIPVTPPPPESGVIVMAPIQFVPGISPASMPKPMPVQPSSVQVQDEKKEAPVTEEDKKKQEEKKDEKEE